jgi:hypothetical protein
MIEPKILSGLASALSILTANSWYDIVNKQYLKFSNPKKLRKYLIEKGLRIEGKNLVK